MDGLKILVAGDGLLMDLAVRHFREFFQRKEIPIDVEKLTVSDPSDLQAAVEAAGPARAVRVEPNLSAEWLRTCPVLPMPVSLFRVADVFLRHEDRWEPSLLLERALHDVIVRQGKNLDLHESAYVIGEGADLRVLGGVVLGLGFRRVCLVGEDERDCIEQKELLQQFYLSAEIVPLPAHALTLQTVGASLLVNALDLTSRQELASDLAYFNFMKRGGLVVDMMALRMNNVMLEEALRAGLRIVPPHEISGAAELMFAAQLGLGALAPPLEFLNSWFEFLRTESDAQPVSDR